MIWYDKSKKEYSYDYGPKFLDGSEAVLGFIPFSSLIFHGSKKLRDSLSNDVFYDIGKSDLSKAYDVSINTELNLLDIMGQISSFKVVNAIGKVSGYASTGLSAQSLMGVILEDDMGKLVRDLVSPGLMVSNRREQINQRYFYASSLISEMINSGDLKYEYNKKGGLTHNLAKKDIEGLNYAVLNFMISNGAYAKNGDY